MDWTCSTCGTPNDEALVRCRACRGARADALPSTAEWQAPVLRPTAPAWAAILAALIPQAILMSMAMWLATGPANRVDEGVVFWQAVLVVVEAGLLALAAARSVAEIRMRHTIRRTADVATPATLCFTALQLVLVAVFTSAFPTNTPALGWLLMHAAAMTAVFCAVVWRDLETREHSSERTPRSDVEQT